MGFSDPARINVKYDDATVQGMLTLLKASPFPESAAIDAETPWKLGIEHDYLKKLKNMFETAWNWKALEEKIAKFDHYLVHYDDGQYSFDLHYVHVKSLRRDAIPLILLHGWPGTFFDFHKVVESLTNPQNPESPAFHVVIPSLPGYFLSTLPRHEGWNIVHVAKVFNELMVSVLGYTKYVGQGGDWGSMILRIMGSTFPEHLILIHFNMFYIAPSLQPDLSQYSDSEKQHLKRLSEIGQNEFGYLAIQSTKPFTIGLAIASSPLAILAYICDKMYGWSDPKLLDPMDIIDTAALYFLSGSFPSSIMMYNQNAKLLLDLAAPPSAGSFLLKNKLGFSSFPYELGRAPRVEIEKYGPLVYHKEHNSGGHFPALDSPESFVSGLREFFGAHWNRD